jgi:nicotinate-nucleotide adenylyltransferase
LRYGIFGGTFDPFHAGHMSMITGALASGFVDRIWVIPSGYPPKKDAQLLTLAPYRFYMAQAALKEISGCQVLPIEIVKKQVSYTVDTLAALRGESLAGPDDELIMICGTDILFEIEDWYHPEIILKKAKLLIAKRPGIMQQETLHKVRDLEEKYKIQITFFPIDGVNVSSREIRRKQDFSALSAPVLQFIKKHALYPKDNPLSYLKENTHREIFEYGTILFSDLSRSRLLHSLDVAMLSIRYAVIYGVDPDKAAIAGLLHDCAKELPISRQASLARKIDDRCLPENALLHAPAGAAYAKERYGIQDEDILLAIRYHTTGCEQMTDIEKIVYLADKIEPARDYEDLSKLRELAVTDLDAAVIACLQAVKDSFIRKDMVFHGDSSLALDTLLKHKSRNETSVHASAQKIPVKEEKMDTLSIASEIVRILNDKKAVDVELIPVAEKTSLADYFIVASGTSTTHIKALSDEVEFVLKNEQKIYPDHIEGLSTGRWVLLDYKDIVVHIFHPEERAHYTLDKLWITKRPEGSLELSEDDSDNDSQYNSKDDAGHEDENSLMDNSIED